MRSPTESPLLIRQHLRRWALRGALASRLHEQVPGGVVRKGRWAVRFIRPRQMLEMIGVSRSTIRRMVQEGSFPQPVRITKRNAGYVLEAVEARMQARTQGLAWESASAGAASLRTEPSQRGRSKLALAQQQAAVTVRARGYRVRTDSARTLDGSAA